MSIISKEFLLPTEKSYKRKWRYTFLCETCGDISSVWYQKKKFVCICESCRKGKISTEEFIKRAQVVHGDLFDYSKVEYKSNKKKVTIICRKHGEFSQRCSDHLDGCGCLKCATEERTIASSFTIDVWRDRLSKFPHVTMLTNNIGYYGSNVLLCKYHGEFAIKNGAILNSVELCPTCLKYRHTRQSTRINLVEKPTTLYCVYLPNNNTYKIGVTCQLLEERFRSVTYIIVWVKIMTYNDALDLEHYIHTKYFYDRMMCPDVPIITNGNTRARGDTEQYATNPIPSLEKLKYIIIEYNEYRALHGQPCIESYLNGETPTK